MRPGGGLPEQTFASMGAAVRWMAARRGHGDPKSLKGNIIKAANGRIPSAYGFHWRARDA